jgi:hypothetical protein
MSDAVTKNNDFAYLLGKLVGAHTHLQQQAARSVDTALVVRNWLFGWYIVEFEQGNRLSEGLARHGLRGISQTNLKLCRSFYLAYPEIRQTLSAESLNTPDSQSIAGYFALGWSHYVVLITTATVEERQFYEIEAKQSSWGVRELKRQMASALFERLTLSRNQDEVKALAQVGQLIEKPKDVIKSPYVLEFLDLPEHPVYSATGSGDH